MLHSLVQETQELAHEWGIVAVVAVAPICLGAYAIETFATEPMVDTWYADASVTSRFRGFRFALVILAEVWTMATSGYGVIG